MREDLDFAVAFFEDDYDADSVRPSYRVRPKVEGLEFLTPRRLATVILHLSGRIVRKLPRVTAATAGAGQGTFPRLDARTITARDNWLWCSWRGFRRERHGHALSAFRNLNSPPR